MQTSDLRRKLPRAHSHILFYINTDRRIFPLFLCPPRRRRRECPPKGPLYQEGAVAEGDWGRIPAAADKASPERGGGICEHREQMTERLSKPLRSNLSGAARQMPAGIPGRSSDMPPACHSLLRPRFAAPFIRGAFGGRPSAARRADEGIGPYRLRNRIGWRERAGRPCARPCASLFPLFLRDLPVQPRKCVGQTPQLIHQPGLDRLRPVDHRAHIGRDLVRRHHIVEEPLL